MNEIEIKYNFQMPDGSIEVFVLRLSAPHLELMNNIPDQPPTWTKLDFHQCGNCPLDKENHPHCPAAANIVGVARRFNTLISYDKIKVEITTRERRITKDTTAQHGISSLLGLVIAASGCPRTAFFKPMARFHLPMASSEETLFRVTSMYFMAQYFLMKEGRDADLKFDGLVRIYENMQTVNRALAGRLRAATEKDSMVNAIIMLDHYAMAFDIAIEQSLEQMRYLFSPFLEPPLPN
ncbi:MAG: hypothetical protein GY859_23835 [Desulfobacterales bacterium]|nr:hypothetical protein [Desulfobacterales bacterium]